MSSEPRPNIILITTDQQRYDAMSYNGNPHLMTPNLDAWAHQGTNFECAYTSSPTCIAARRTIMTGQCPARHGIIGYYEHKEYFPEHTLPGELSKAGYQTQLVGKLHSYPQRKRYGFDNMVLSECPEDRPASKGWYHNDYVDWLKAQGVRADPVAHGLNPGGGRLGRP